MLGQRHHLRCDDEVGLHRLFVHLEELCHLHLLLYRHLLGGASCLCAAAALLDHLRELSASKDFLFDIIWRLYSKLLEHLLVLSKLFNSDAVSNSSPHVVECLFGLLCLAPPQVNDRVGHYALKLLRRQGMEDLLATICHAHYRGEQNVELCEVKVVLVRVKELEGTLLVPSQAALEPGTARRRKGLAHQKVH